MASSRRPKPLHLNLSAAFKRDVCIAYAQNAAAAPFRTWRRGSGLRPRLRHLRTVVASAGLAAFDGVGAGCRRPLPYPRERRGPPATRQSRRRNAASGGGYPLRRAVQHDGPSASFPALVDDPQRPRRVLQQEDGTTRPRRSNLAKPPTNGSDAESCRKEMPYIFPRGPRTCRSVLQPVPAIAHAKS